MVLCVLLSFGRCSLISTSVGRGLMLWPVEADFDGYLLRGADVLRLCLSFQYKAGPEGLVSKKKKKSRSNYSN
jgi:hypothetical protein